MTLIISRALIVGVICAVFAVRAHGNGDTLQKGALTITPVIGLKMYNPWGGNQSDLLHGSVHFPLVAGVRVGVKDFPFFIDTRYNFLVTVDAKDTLRDIGYRNTVWAIGAGYSFTPKKFKQPVNIGLAWFLHKESSFYIILGGSRWGIAPSISVPLKSLEIEFRWEPRHYDSGFIDGDRFSIQLLYKPGFGKTKGKDFENEKGALDLLAGFHFFLNRHYYDNVDGDRFNPLIAGPELGLEYTFDNNMFIQFRRNLWIGLSGGELSYDINGYFEQVHAGVGYHLKFNETQGLRVGLSHVWMRDHGYDYTFKLYGIDFYPEKGIGLTVTYPTRFFDVESRAVFAYYINDQIDSKTVNAFDQYRISVGIVKRLQL